jgi:hypothetical protein
MLTTDMQGGFHHQINFIMKIHHEINLACKF